MGERQGDRGERAAEERSALPPDRLPAEPTEAAVLALQRSAGNAAVGRLLRKRKSLTDALEFETRFQDPGPWAGRLRHPMTQTLIRLFHAQLVARFVHDDKKEWSKYASEQNRLVQQLWRALLTLKDQAPSPWMFQGEAMVVGSMLTEFENATMQLAAGHWSEGREDLVIRNLQLFDTAFARVFSGGIDTTRVGRRVPGGTVQRRIYVGTIVIPDVILNFYLSLDVTFPGSEGAGTVDVAAKDQVGATHDVGQSRTVEVGGEGGGVSVDVGARGPEGVGAKKKIKGPGGTEATGSVKLGAGGKPEASVEVGGEQGKVELGTKGVSAQYFAPGDAWKATAELNPADGSVTYSATHPTAGGISISGSLDKATLAVIAPEVRIGGVQIKPQLIVEAWPARLAYERTQTQTEESVRQFQRICQAELIIMGAPLAVGTAAGAGAALATSGVAAVIAEGAAAAIPLLAR
jgi:hypothetical protein